MMADQLPNANPLRRTELSVPQKDASRRPSHDETAIGDQMVVPLNGSQTWWVTLLLRFRLGYPALQALL